MIFLGVLLLIIYIFVRHPLLLGAGVLLLIIGMVLLLSSGIGHYGYY
jgi:hypothetical protein